jgi:hypothetical protein
MFEYWWNTNYLFRKQISITANVVSIAAGTQVDAAMPISTFVEAGKVRSDYEDIEVVRYDIEQDTHTVLARSVDSDYVYFQLVEELELGKISEDEYFIYYGNARLTSQPTRPTFTSNEWGNQIGVSDYEISYTNPGESWISGKATEAGSKFALTFYGKNIRLIANKTPSSGRVVFEFEDGYTNTIDLFSSETQSSVVVLQRENLSDRKHIVRFETLPDSNTASTGHDVELVRFEHQPLTSITPNQEHVYSLDWPGDAEGTILGGGTSLASGTGTGGTGGGVGGVPSGEHTKELHDALGIDADTVDGYHASAFALSGHTHPAYENNDEDAIHDNIAGEIQAITNKAVPTPSDIVIIEDAADSYNKKRASIGNLPGITPDHGGLSGLNDDDHPQYLRTDGTRLLTGDLDINNNVLQNPSDPVSGNQVGDRDYNDTRYVLLGDLGPLDDVYVNIDGDVMTGSLTVPATNSTVPALV